MIKKSRIDKRLKIKNRVHKKMQGKNDKPRLTVYRSLHHIYAQIVDDAESKTLVAASTLSPQLREEVKKVKGKKNIAKLVGIEVAKRAIEHNIKKVAFDRNGYPYHGVIKSLADGARETGLEF